MNDKLIGKGQALKELVESGGLPYELGVIIAGLLRKLRDIDMGCPIIDSSDVPEHLLDSSEEWGTEAQRKWLLDEMIWAFEQSTLDLEDMGSRERIQNGRRLFVKYYDSLRFVIRHENLHKAFRHMATWDKNLWKQDARLANMACDYVINLMIYDTDPAGQSS